MDTEKYVDAFLAALFEGLWLLLLLVVEVTKAILTAPRSEDRW